VEKRLASLEEPKAPSLDVAFWTFLVNLPFKPLESQEGGMKSMTKGISRPNLEVGVQVPASVPSSCGSKWPWKLMFQQLGLQV